MSQRLLKKGVDDFHWDQFEWALWLNSAELQGCSFEAQGVWMNMLCVMFLEGAPRGVLRDDLVAFARRVRHLDRLGEIRKCVRELEKANVFSSGGDLLSESARDLSAWLRPDDIVCRHMFRRWLEKYLKARAGRVGGLRSGEARRERVGDGEAPAKHPAKDVGSKSQRSANGTRSTENGDAANGDGGFIDSASKQTRTNDQATLSLESRTKIKTRLDVPAKPNSTGEKGSGSARGGKVEAVGELAASTAETLARTEMVEMAERRAAFVAELPGDFARLCEARGAQRTWLNGLVAQFAVDGHEDVVALQWLGALRDELARKMDESKGDTKALDNPMGWLVKRIYAWANERAVTVTSCPERGAA